MMHVKATREFLERNSDEPIKTMTRLDIIAEKTSTSTHTRKRTRGRSQSNCRLDQVLSPKPANSLNNHDLTAPALRYRY